MGQSLSEPKTEKKTEKSDNGHFSVGASCMQGWRLGELLAIRQLEVLSLSAPSASRVVCSAVVYPVHSRLYEVTKRTSSIM